MKLSELKKIVEEREWTHSHIEIIGKHIDSLLNVAEAAVVLTKGHNWPSIIDGYCSVPLWQVTDVIAERYLLAKSGFGLKSQDHSNYILVLKIDGGRGNFCCDEYDWVDGRTMPPAHKYIVDNFDTLESGAVVDVEYILNEKSAPSAPDRLESLQYLLLRDVPLK